MTADLSHDKNINVILLCCENEMQRTDNTDHLTVDCKQRTVFCNRLVRILCK